MKINYDLISMYYQKRYKKDSLAGIRNFLNKISFENTQAKILDVGTGTGFCLGQLENEGGILHGLDLSLGMLLEARKNNPEYILICADANRLPYKKENFNLITCMNVIHHLEDPREFIGSVKELLKDGGSLKIITYDPEFKGDHWYIYDYFDEVLENDIRRYPRLSEISGWMNENGYCRITTRIIDNVENSFTSEEVFSDPFLSKTASSQLAFLTNDEYESGVKRIRDKIAVLRKNHKEEIFSTKITFHLVEGFK